MNISLSKYGFLIVAVISLGILGVVAVRVHDAFTVPIEASPALLNLGRFAEGSILNVTTTLRNTSDQPLSVEHIGTSCGCTTTSSVDRLASKASVPLQVRFDSHGKLGNVNKTIWVFVAGHTDRPVKVTMIGQCVKELETTPEQLELGALSVKQTITKSFTLQRIDGQPLQIEGIQASPTIKAAISQRSDKMVRISVATTSPDMPGRYEDTITLHVNHPTVKEVTVPVHYDVVSAYTLNPPQLNCGTLQVGQTLHTSAHILGTDKQRLRIVSVPPDVQATLQFASNSEGVLNVTYTPKGGKGRIIKSSILLETGNPQQKVIRIPLYAAIQ